MMTVKVARFDFDKYTALGLAQVMVMVVVFKAPLHPIA